MRSVREIVAIVVGTVSLVLQERVANFISVTMMLLAIAYVVAIALVTVRWIGPGWLLLTMPLGILLGIPAMKRMARLSQRITD